jgi:hypothetical protein
MKSTSFSFGIYPGGQLGATAGMTNGPSDKPDKILEALDILQGEHYALMVRCYIIYKGKDNPPVFSNENPEQFAVNGRQLDLVLCFQSFEEVILGWLDFIIKVIEEYHPYIGKLQITEEANVNLPVLDGHYPKSRVALVEGIVTAHNKLKKMDLQIPVGFNTAPDFNPDKPFWKEIALMADRSFYDALGYVGLDFFPDVFRPIPGAEKENVLDESIKYIISLYRNDMVQAGIRHDIPLHITENGWPTGDGRTEKKQAERMEKIIRAVYFLRATLNITHYELFSLRDADSKNPDIFYQFGIMKDDYTPKKAFFTFKKLVSELGTVSDNG